MFRELSLVYLKVLWVCYYLVTNQPGTSPQAEMKEDNAIYQKRALEQVNLHHVGRCV